jgi:hypothetical protein
MKEFRADQILEILAIIQFSNFTSGLYENVIIKMHKTICLILLVVRYACKNSSLALKEEQR